MTADHKVLNEGGESRNNHPYSVLVQDFATQRIQSYPFKKLKLLRRQKGVNESFSSRRKSQKSILLSILQNLVNFVKIFIGIIVHLRLTVPRQMGLLRERYAE